MKDELEILRKLIPEILKSSNQSFNYPDKKKFHYDKIKNILKNANKNKLLEAIVRHRLISFIQDEKIISRIEPDFAETLSILKMREQFNILRLCSLTLEIYRLLDNKGINTIIFKGIPLSIQSTGSFNARGLSRDLDVLISINQLKEAINVLESVGFVLIKRDEYIKSKNNLKISFKKLISNQMTLIRQNKGTNEYIDLHWKLTSVYGELDNFRDLYDNSAKIEINGKIIKTLNHKYALYQACIHSAVDNWMCLRNLIDISRLSLKVSKEEKFFLRNKKIINWSSAVAYEWTKEFALKDLMKLKSKEKIFLLNRSYNFQSRPRRNNHNKDKSLLLRLKDFFFILGIQNSLKHKIFLIIKFVSKS